MSEKTFTAEGGCTCGEVRYRLERAPLFVNCCHCRWCQRESGSAFALNASIETDNIAVLTGTPQATDVATQSGKGQRLLRCPKCRVTLWSHYLAVTEAVSFVRVGTLDDPDQFSPDIHLFTDSKQPWVEIPKGARSVPRYYDRKEVWPPESLQRWQTLFG